MDNSPIGIFDSGLGGLTVARAVIDQLPDEEVLYLGDTAHAPYGPRQIADVRRLALAGLDELADSGVKALVIACNTATAAALPDARERYWLERGIPVFEVISPAARAAVATTRNGRIGIIGTEATVKSQAYLNSLAAVPDIEVFQQACPRFVEFVEHGLTTGPLLQRVAEEYLDPLREQDIDTLVLGCTHYPLLTGAISRVMGENVTLVTSSSATARSVYNELTDRDLLHEQREPGDHPNHRFQTTGASDQFHRLASRFLGPEVGAVEQVHTDVDEDQETPA